MCVKEIVIVICVFVVCDCDCMWRELWVVEWSACDRVCSQNGSVIVTS